MTGIPPIDLATTELEWAAAGCLPRELCEKYCVVPVRRFDNTLVVAVTDPPNLLMLDELRFVSSYNIQPVTAPAAAITQAIPRAYKPRWVELPPFLDAIELYPDDPQWAKWTVTAAGLLLCNTINTGLRFFAVEPDGVWFWRTGRWTREEAIASERISDAIIRHFCSVASQSPPAASDRTRFVIWMDTEPEPNNFVVAVVNPDGRPRALVELMSEEDLAHRREFRLPAPAPPQHAVVPGWPIELADPYRG